MAARSGVPGRALVGLAGACLLGACAGLGAANGNGPLSVTDSAPGAADPFVTQPGAPYLAAIHAVVADSATVWIETDLVKRWLQGRAAFEATLGVVAAEARLPGVAGVKIADELGYGDGLNTPQAAQSFLDAAAAGLRVRLPHTQILVDMVVPELGCLPGRTDLGMWPRQCAAMQERATPAASLAAVDGYLGSGDIDVLDLSAGLRPDAEYAAIGVSRDDAMRQAWAEVARRGWGQEVRLQARKALAHPGAYAGDAAAAERDLHTFVDIPLASGAKAVDIWTWRQTYDGQVVRLMDPGLVDNGLWDGLRARSEKGVQLWTHMTPSSLEVGLSRDVAAMTQVMSAVFVAAGTG
jgi:hypothetical protein